MIARQRNIDLTEGPIVRKLLWFFLPMLAGSLFQQLYTTMDAVMIGQFAGKNGLAAIDSVYNLLKLPVHFFIGLSTGATLLVSRHFGAKREQELRQTVHTALAFALAGGMLLSAAGVALAPAGLGLLQVPEEIRAQALSYVRIYFASLSAVMVYNVGAGILRAVGDTKRPFYFLAAANGFNVALDLLLVGMLKWGVTGAALSTALAQLLSAVLVVRALVRTDLEVRLVPRNLRFHGDALRSMVALGLPIALQSSLYPIANILIQSNINRMGTDSIAAWALCGKLDFVFWLAVDALAVAVSTFAAQNDGAGHFARIRKGVRSGMGLTLLLTAGISAALYFFSEPLGLLFLTKADLPVIRLAGRFMRFLVPLYFLYAVGEILSGALRGMGQTLWPMLLTLAGTWAFRILWMLLVVPQSRNMFTVLGSYPASWLLTSFLLTAFYVRFQRKKC